MLLTIRRNSIKSVVDITPECLRAAPRGSPKALTEGLHLLLAYTNVGSCYIATASNSVDQSFCRIISWVEVPYEGKSQREIQEYLMRKLNLLGWSTGGLNASQVAELIYNNQPVN